MDGFHAEHAQNALFSQINPLANDYSAVDPAHEGKAQAALFRVASDHDPHLVHVGV